MRFVFAALFTVTLTAHGQLLTQSDCSYWVTYFDNLSYYESMLRVATMKNEYNEVDYYGWMIQKEHERVERESTEYPNNHGGFLAR